MARIREPWMHDVMYACHEISAADLTLVRTLYKNATTAAERPAAVAEGEGAAAVAEGEGAAAVAEGPCQEITPGDLGEHAESKPDDQTAVVLAALDWATKLHDHGMLVGLADALPQAVIDEQVRNYQASQGVVAKVSSERHRILVYPHLLKSRMQTAAALDTFLRSTGWAAGTRLPRNACPHFLKTSLVWPKMKDVGTSCRMMRRWHAEWQKNTSLQTSSTELSTATTRSGGTMLVWSRRQRQGSFQGRPVACPWLRQALFEWFMSMRYSIDWEAVRGSFRSGEGHKCMARFTKKLMRTKAEQLLQDYCYESLLRGLKPQSVKLTSKWWTGWQRDYGLSMRKANRKYKVPKAVMGERLEIGWLNCARVRALCLATNGYDPEMENWDQSPFHHNESGSCGMSTLAVAGTTVPLIEGHADTRARWTANLVTWSNKQRIRDEGPPYCEFMFKADGDTIAARLREHVARRGVGKWVSVATSDKGSYRQEHVLRFLDTHLPKMSQSRQWRIIFADDFSAHLSDQVLRLCWSRGYVFLAHGGGVTPVVQTPDTDLNQHVKRSYTAVETTELLQQMRDGTCVPHCTPEKCIDLMEEVLRHTPLHLGAADGYLKTGLTVALDGSQDEEVVREALVFWHERQMRTKINAAVAEVREEVRAGRLKWCQRDVQHVIKPYPKHGRTDAILSKQGDDTWIPEGEAKYVDDDDDDGDDDADEDDESGDDAEDGDEDPRDEAGGAAGQHDEAVGAAGPPDEAGGADVPPDEEGSSAEAGEQREARSSGRDDTMVDREVCTSEPAANNVSQCQTLIAALEGTIPSLRTAGAITAVASIDNEIRKVRRRLRGLCREDEDVVLALRAHRDAEDKLQRKRLRDVREAQAKMLTKAKLQRELQDVNEEVKKRKRQVMEQESILAEQAAVKKFSLDELGKGKANGGATAGRKNRHEVLDRLGRSCGLSPAQRNDFKWWKEEWDSVMLNAHKENWADTFASWMQRVLSDWKGGVSNAFSLFVHSETCRCLRDEYALQVP